MQKPQTSVVPVRKMEEDWAGSKPKRLRNSGIKAPARPPTHMFRIIARRKTKERLVFLVMRKMTKAEIRPMRMPFRNPLAPSLRTILKSSKDSISPRAMDLMATARV